MTHYLYKPHVQGPEFITTPDLLIDHVRRATGGAGGEVEFAIRASHEINTRPEIQRGSEPATVAPAYFLIAAGGGVILSAGVEYQAGASRLLLLPRFAWRLKYIEDHLPSLTLALAGGETLGLEQFPAPALVMRRFGDNAADLPGLPSLPGGIMLCVTATGLARPLAPASHLEIRLADPVLKRELTHRVALQDGGQAPWPERPAARYTTGPTAGQVKHYI